MSNNCADVRKSVYDLSGYIPDGPGQVINSKSVLPGDTITIQECEVICLVKKLKWI